MTDEYLTYEDIKAEAESPHVTADMLNILLTRTKELNALKKHDDDKLKELLESIEKKLAEMD